MRIYTVPENFFIFVDIPRTASTSIQQKLGLSFDDKFLLYRDNHGDIDHAHKILWKQKLNPLLFFSFSVCRNPYDRLVSMYSFHFRSKSPEKRLSIREWFESDILNTGEYYSPFIFQHPFVMSSNLNRIVVKKICRFETLLNDLSDVFSKIKIGDLTLPHQVPSKHLHYSEYYKDSYFRNMVYKFFQRDFEIFGYSSEL